MKLTLPPKSKDFLANSPVGQVISFIFILGTGTTIALLGALLVLLWRKLLEIPYRSLGLFKPSNWGSTILGGIGIGVGVKFIFLAVIMPALGRPPGDVPHEFLVGNLSGALLFSLYVIIVGGICEELVFRGFYFRQFEIWFGKSSISNLAVVLTSSLIFAIPHFYQGGYGAIQAGLVGVIYGTLFLINSKNLWLVMIAHACFNLFAIYLTFQGLIPVIATLFFGT